MQCMLFSPDRFKTQLTIIVFEKFRSFYKILLFNIFIPSNRKLKT